ncbi:MAG: ABC transporter permease [Lachnospiraceae bacterium]|nr:ABC transporter permease [Lachnospiraceae bacterium]
MKKYVVDKLAQYVIVLAIVSVIIFVMVRLNPTDPVSVIVGGKQTTAETVANIRAEFNLDKTYFEQYLIWIKGIFQGDFGTSFQYRQNVTSLIMKRLPVTVGLVLLSSVIALVLSVPLGIITALKQNTPLDTGLSVIQLILVACPPFLTSILMILLITIFTPGVSFTGSFTNFNEYMQRILYPSIALAFSMIALTSRVTKTSMIEQLNSNYTLVAKSKGLSMRQRVLNHCLKNSLIPVITIFGTQMGVLIVGTVLVENVFSLAGLGSILIDGVKSCDYPIVQGIVMLLVFVFITISMLLDMLYAVIDPRIRAKSGK